jgi:tetratricopeptide (TPR) repeat protein
LDLSKHIKEEYFEQYCFMKELFDKVKNENKKLGIKLGFCLYEILCRQNKFNECIPLLMEMKKILKNETLSGVNLKISIDYYLSIASRIGFISVLIGNKKAAEYAVKKLNKILGIIQNDKGDKKLALIYKAYTFIISILNIDIGNYENKFKEKSIDFRNNFFPINSEQKSINNYFVTLKNKDDLIIDLYSLNNMDYSLGTLANKIMENYTNITLAKKLLFTNQFLDFIVGIHNNINRLSESYCTDYNINKRADYIKKIYNFYNIAFNYVKSVMDQEPLLETDFVKTILINIQATCAHVYLYNNKLDIVKNLVKFFDDLGKMLLIKDSTPSYELIYKVKGDFWLKKGDYSGAITYYQKVINKMETNNQKRPTIFFNLGYAYYLSGNKRNAIENLNQFINAYRVFDYEKKTFTLLIRQDVIAKKIKLIKYLLKNMSNN